MFKKPHIPDFHQSLNFIPSIIRLLPILLLILSNLAFSTAFSQEMDLDQSGTPIENGGTCNFGGIETGGNNTLTFTIANTGDTDLTIATPLVLNGPDNSEFEIRSEPDAIINSGKSSNFRIRFSPATGGVKTASIAISNNDADENPYILNLTGTGIAATPPEMDLNESGTPISSGGTYDYGTVDVGKNTALNFTIVNNGEDDLLITLPLALSGPDASEFEIRNEPDATIRGGRSSNLRVRFSPASAGIKTASIAIASNDADENPYVLNLSGTGHTATYTVSGTVTDGTTPLQDVTITFSHDGHAENTDISGLYAYNVTEGTSTTITASKTGYDSWSPASIILNNIGSDRTGQDFEGTFLTFIITGNVTDGSSPLQDVTIIFSHDGHTENTDAGGNYSYSVPNGTSTTITPEKTGYNIWTPLSLTLNNITADQSGNDFQGNLITAPEMDLSQAGTPLASGGLLDFGSMDAETDSTITLTIENTGTAGLTLTTPLSVTGPDAAEFSIAVQPAGTVSPDGSTTFEVTFSPASAGVKSAAVAIENNDSDENPYTINLTGAVQQITYTISGMVTDGTNPLENVTISFSHDGHTEQTDASGNYSYSVPFGTETDITPEKSGYDGWVPAFITLTAISGDQHGQDFSGTIQTFPELDLFQDGMPLLSGDTHSLGILPLGSDTAITFTIHNTGSVVLEVSVPLTITETETKDFTITRQPDASIGAGNSSTFQVLFSPDSAGTSTAAIAIASNDSDENPFTLNLSGTAIMTVFGPGIEVMGPLSQPDPEIYISGNGNEIVSGDTSPSTSDGTDFGNADTLMGSISHNFSIMNQGTTDLSLTGTPKVVISGLHASDFTVISQPSSPIAPSSTVIFAIMFNPSDSGLRTAAVSIDNDDVDENPYTFNIQGTGTVAPDMDVKGNGVSIAHGDNTPHPGDDTYFGDIATNGGTSVHSFTIDNLGSSNLTLTGTFFVTITGADESDFQVTQQPSSPLSPAGSTTFEITFNPSAIGLRTASVSITSDDPDENPYMFAIQGNGVGPGAPLACVPNFYHIFDTDGKITYLDASTNPYTYSLINTAGYEVNAVGYNNQDGLLYAHERGSVISGDSLIRIDATGAIAVLDVTVPFPSWKGDCDLSGNYYFINGTGDQVAVYDISANTISTASTSSNYTALDIAYRAADNRFYGVSGSTLYSYHPSGHAVSTSPITGRLADDVGSGINSNAWGASWTASDGYLYVGNNQSGRLYKVDVNTGVSVYVGTGTGGLSQNDGASCPLAAAPLPNSGTLGDLVWMDFDNNGIQDTGERGLPNVTVTLKATLDGSTVGTTTTDLDGVYSFRNLPPAQYYIEVTLPSGFSFSPQDQGGNDGLDSDINPSTGRTTDITVSVGVIEEAWDVGLTTTGMGGWVWNDSDEDGIQDAGETTGIQGVTVECLNRDAGNSVVQTTVTDANGFYYFSGLTAGTRYRSRFSNLPGGYVFSPRNAGGDDTIDSDPRSSDGRTGSYTMSANTFMIYMDAGIYQDASTPPEIDISGNGNSIPDGDTTPDASDDTDFGGILISAGSVVHTFTITNDASATADITLSGSPIVEITGTHASDFIVTADPSTPVSPGGSTTFQITFDPSDFGLREATVSIVNNDGNENPYDFSIQGTGLAPQMDVLGNGISIADGDDTPDISDDTDFGSVHIVSGMVLHTFTIQDTGDADLNLTDTPDYVAIGGTHASDFTLTAAPSTPISSGGGTTTFTIRFTPGGTGLREANVTIANDDPDENPYNFNIQGTGTSAPEMNVQGNGVSIASGDAAPDVSDDTDFGNADILAETPAHTFTIENTGNADLNLTGTPIIEITGANAGDFLVSQQPSSGTVGSGGGTETFEITFDPTTTGLRQAVITISNDDSDENPYTFAVQGTGTAAPEIDVLGNDISIPSGDSSPDASDNTEFGTTTVSGLPIVKTFKIRNLGSAELNLTDISPYIMISGADAADFSVTGIPENNIGEDGDSTMFDITFDPSTPGTKNAAISIANDDSDENPYTFEIQGVSNADPNPEIDLKQGGTPIASGGTYDYGTQAINSDTDIIFRILNTGGLDLAVNTSLSVTGPDAAEFSILTQPGSPVSGDDSTWFEVRFSPVSGGIKNAAISISNNDSDENPYVLNLTGTGITAPEMDLNQNGTPIADGSSYDFGSHPAGTGTDIVFTIKNTGSADLTMTTPLVITGADAGQFSVQSNPVSPVNAADSTAFTIRFTPTSYGIKSAAISISNNDSDENPYVLNLTGTGNAPEISVLGNFIEISDGDDTPDVADDTDFGSIAAGGGAINKTFTIKNTGNSTLSLTGSPIVLLSGATAFSVQSQPAGTSIAGGDSLTFVVSFDPASAGVKSTTVSIMNDDSDENPYTFELQGTCTADPSPEMDLSEGATPVPDGGNYDYGSHDNGTDTDVTFTITNSGDADLILTVPLTISGADAGEFSIQSHPEDTIAQGTNTTFVVRFSPTSAGAKTAVISIDNNDGDENPYDLNLQGTGTEPAYPEMIVTGNTIEIISGDNTPDSADGTDFGNVDTLNTTLTQDFVIGNSGDSDLNLTGTPAVLITGTHGSDFAVIQQPSTPQAPGSSVIFTIQFNPSDTGVRTATITIANDDSDENPYTFDIQGTGTITPEIDVQGNGITIVNNDNTPDAADNTYFGDIDVIGSTSAKTFTIENPGSDDLNLTGTPRVAITGDAASEFTVTSSQPSTPVPPGSTVTFEITFDPAAIGPREAAISITSNDSDEDPYIFAIMGNGLGTGAPFSCVPNFYHFFDADGKITYLDASTNPYTYNVLSVPGHQINAAGYNAEDGYIYAHNLDAGTIIRIDATMTITNMAASPPFTSYVGDCDRNGNYYFTNFFGNQVAVYDISAGTINQHSISGSRFQAADMAYMDGDGRFYGVRNSTLYIYNPSGHSGSTMAITGSLADDYSGGISGGTWGAAWTANDGYLYVSNNTSGRLYKVDVSNGNSVYIGLGQNNLQYNDGASCPLAAAPLPNAGTLGDRVWIDGNNDGIQDTDEIGLPNVTVTLKAVINGTTLGTTTTDADGYFYFKNLEASEYYLNFGPLPAGFSFAQQDQGGNDAIDSDANPANGETAGITVVVGSITDTWDCGGVTTGLGNWVWNDLDQDGRQDTGEPGVQGVSVALYSYASGSEIQWTTTDENGYYIFTDLAAGNYRIHVSGLPGGYQFSPQNQGWNNEDGDSDVNPGNGQSDQFNLSANEFEVRVDAGIYQNTATQPEMNVTGNSTGITDGDTSPATSDSTDFGSVNTESGSVTVTYTIENVAGATANLTLNGSPVVDITGTHAMDFTVTQQPASTDIAAGTSTTFQITFDPGNAGLREATVSISNNDADKNPYDFAIQGTGLAPEMDVQGNGISIHDGDTTPQTPDSTDFGNMDVDTDSVTHTFTIINSGDANLILSGFPIVEITGTHASDFTVTQQPASTTVGFGGGSVTFDVRFNPSAPGIRTATITISNNDPDEAPYNFDIQGTGTAAPEMDVQGNGQSITDGDSSPSTADDTDFGSADLLLNTVVHTFTIENTGSGDLTLTDNPNIEIAGPNAGDFLVNQQPASGIVAARGGTVTFQVTFDPTMTGLRQATISIANDDSDENPYTFDIQGTGTAAPEMDIKGNGVSIADGDNTPDPSDNTDFGGTLVTGGTILRTFFIENTGSAALTLTDPSPHINIAGSHASDFSVSAIPSTPVAADGGLTSFAITFDPSGTGTRSAIISIASNDSDENPYTFAIQGTGNSDPLPNLELSKSTDKASALPGETVEYTIIYSNTGTADATAVVILDAIPPNTTYVTSSASAAGMTLLFSHDDGLNYDFSQAAPVTHLQFQRTTPLSPGNSGTITFEVTID